ncbi:hypothetical protein RGQ29_001332 [Quercus rubra]|uniref:RIN4 pathogenic type III effector avirulence factor Avr cleavage site domain-containing protein n=1 Tax=Quercus rubra TaxID=3512 RepID=A0AAN7GFW6_QUERU|nr:hypothetical protein RGQ29_001332 [Quercus rubra]
MSARKEKNGWLSVPEFGGWDKQAPASPNYSVVFSQARANRKHLKTDLSDLRSNLENERELINANHDHHQDDPVMRKKKILTYINCCIRP